MSHIDQLEQLVQELKARPHGPACGSQQYKECGQAMVRLCGGNTDQARTLWKEIYNELGYMPASAHVVLKWAARADDLSPDVEAPELT